MNGPPTEKPAPQLSPREAQQALWAARRALLSRLWARAKVIGYARAFPTTLRARLIGAFLVVVVVAVFAETISHMAEESRRLESELDKRATRVAEALRQELEQTAQALDFEIESTADPRGPVARALSSGRTEARVLSAKTRLRADLIDILKVVQADGTIVSSGHWSASFGARDPLIELYKKSNGRETLVVDEATPAGTSPALERWAVGRSGSREVVVVAGRFLDAPALMRLRERTGADVLALCFQRADARCITAAATEVDFSQLSVRANYVIKELPLSTATLLVAQDRGAIDEVRTSILRRALLVGVLVVLFAMVLGTWLAKRITWPIERLHEQASALGEGDLRARVAPSPSGGQEVAGLVAAFNRMAEDLERGQTRLRQAERVSAWQEIARGLAHELKNPLTPILSAMEILQKARRLGRADFDDILTEQTTAVVEEVMRLKELSDAFARFARLPDRKPEPLRLAELCDNAITLYASAADVQVERHYDAALAPIDADRTQVSTVLGNLVKNAVEAIEAKGTVRLSAVQEGAWVVLTVEDSGPGIDASIADRLFTPYVTTKGSRGTGLGLALVHRIVVEHGGSIEAKRSALGGASFVIMLPYSTATDAS